MFMVYFRNQMESRLYQNDYALISEINAMQSSWKAGPYRHYEYLTVREVNNMAGGHGGRFLRCFFEFFLTHKEKTATSFLNGHLADLNSSELF